MCGEPFSNTAKGWTLDAEVGCNMVKLYLVEHVGVALLKIEITLFGCFEQKAFGAIDGDIEGGLSDKPSKRFPLIRFFV